MSTSEQPHGVALEALTHSLVRLRQATEWLAKQGEATKAAREVHDQCELTLQRSKAGGANATQVYDALRSAAEVLEQTAIKCQNVAEHGAPEEILTRCWIIQRDENLRAIPATPTERVAEAARVVLSAALWCLKDAREILAPHDSTRGLALDSEDRISHLAHRYAMGRLVHPHDLEVTLHAGIEALGLCARTLLAKKPVAVAIVERLRLSRDAFDKLYAEVLAQRGVDISDSGPYATPDDAATAEERGYTVTQLRALRASTQPALAKTFGEDSTFDLHAATSGGNAVCFKRGTNLPKQQMWKRDVDSATRTRRTFMFASHLDGVGNRMHAEIVCTATSDDSPDAPTKAELELHAQMMVLGANAGVELAAKGYDPVQALKSLPKLVEDVEELLGFLSQYPHQLEVDISGYLSEVENTVEGLRAATPVDAVPAPSRKAQGRSR